MFMNVSPASSSSEWTKFVIDFDHHFSHRRQCKCVNQSKISNPIFSTTHENYSKSTTYYSIAYSYCKFHKTLLAPMHMERFFSFCLKIT